MLKRSLERSLIESTRRKANYLITGIPCSIASYTVPGGSPAVVIEELSHLGVGSLDENRVVQSLLAIRGGDVQRDFHDELSDGDDPGLPSRQCGAG